VPATIGLSWDAESKDAAVEVAGKAMADFARPGTEEKQWANDLARWLTVQATADYSAVDPANIPASTVTGKASLTVDEANGYGVIAKVPTNAGTYTLQLLRTGQDAPWKVNRLTPPGS
jgi:monomeric isocitrate dehydrogenase